MTINIDPASTPGTAVLLDRRAAGARQDRWMLELERAGIATQATKDSQVRRDVARQAHDKTADAEVRNPSGEQQQPRADAADTAAPDEQQARAPADDAAAAASSVRRPAAAAFAHAVARPVARAVAHPTLPALAAVACDAAPALAPRSVLQLQRAILAAATDGASVASHRHADLPEPAGQPALAADAVDTPPATDEAPLTAAAPGMPEQTDNAAFEKRLLHVYLGDDGVHAWLRDAQLQGSSARAVAQALAEQVAATGKPLAGLNINGKPVATRPETERDAVTFARTARQEPSRFAPHFYQSIEEGNS